MSLSPEKLSQRFEELAQRFVALRQELDQLRPLLQHDMDRDAVESMMTELIWAAENSSTIAKHVIGEAMDDKMGFERSG
jgi:predicted component of type VI protein secretion system